MDYFVTWLNLIVAGLIVGALGEVQSGQVQKFLLDRGKEEDAHRILVLLPFPYHSRHCWT
jgi:hypothetical protein